MGGARLADGFSEPIRDSSTMPGLARRSDEPSAARRRLREASPRGSVGGGRIVKEDTQDSGTPIQSIQP
eukprot:238096-Pyramimonas_sp.AAC.1